MKLYTPTADEHGPILHNGVRQELEEDLGLLEDFTSTIARYEACWRLTEDMRYRRHIAKLYTLRSNARAAFLKKWNKP